MERPDDSAILPRDKLLRDSFTAAEIMTFTSVLICTTLAFWAADPRLYWVLGFFIIAGGFTLFTLKTHEMHHPFFVDMLWPRFWLLATPACWSLVQFTAGIWQSPLKDIELDGMTYRTLGEINVWLPVTTAPAAHAVALVGFACIYVASICLFLIPKSRYFFERLLPLLCLNAVLVCIFGLLQKALRLEAPLFTQGTGRADFFAFFPYDGHWAAFASIWCAACVAMALLSTRYTDSPDFIESIGPWYLCGAVLLGGSGWLVEARWPAVVSLLTLSTLLLVVMLEFARRRDDSHHRPIACLCAIGSVCAFTLGLLRAFQASGFAEAARVLRQAAADMFARSPVFGWGFDSFQTLLPFFADDRLAGARYERAASDLLQFLAEFGLLGCAVPALTFLYLLVRYLRTRASFKLTNHLLLGCLAVLVLAACDTPFMSPAVFLSFFVLLFSALRWADLSRTKVDEVDARPNLIAHPSERRVPFFTGDRKEIFK
ncbi:MAG: O-antigen ligase family protein [Verrucomicrobiota bacterium]